MVVLELHLNRLGSGIDQSSQGLADTPGLVECGCNDFSHRRLILPGTRGHTGAEKPSDRSA